MKNLTKNIKYLNWEDVEENFELTPFTRETSQVQLIRYAGASGDFNPIHTVPEYAKEAGLEGTIIHGMLSKGILGELITKNFQLRNVKKFSTTFKSIAKPGDKLTAKAVVKKKYEKDGIKYLDLKGTIEDENGDIKVESKITIAF